MPLALLVGPANAGKVALLLDRYLESLDTEPVLVLRRALASTPLNGLSASARYGGFASGLLAVISELEAGLLPPEDVSGDLARLYGAYTLELDRLELWDRDLERRYAVERIETELDAWDRRPVYAYGFEDLTGAQWALLRALAGRSDVTVSLPYEPGRPAFASLARTMEDLSRLAGGAIEELPPAAGSGHPALEHLARQLFGAGTAAQPPALEGALRSRLPSGHSRSRSRSRVGFVSVRPRSDMRSSRRCASRGGSPSGVTSSPFCARPTPAWPAPTPTTWRGVCAGSACVRTSRSGPSSSEAIRCPRSPTFVRPPHLWKRFAAWPRACSDPPMGSSRRPSARPRGSTCAPSKRRQSSSRSSRAGSSSQASCPSMTCWPRSRTSRFGSGRPAMQAGWPLSTSCVRERGATTWCSSSASRRAASRAAPRTRPSSTRTSGALSTRRTTPGWAGPSRSAAPATFSTPPAP